VLPTTPSIGNTKEIPSRRLRLPQSFVHNLSEPTGDTELDTGFLIVRVAIASAIIFVILFSFRFFWPLGLLAAIPAVGFLFVYLRWAIQQTRFAEGNVKEANLVRKGWETDKSEAVETPTIEKHSAAIEQTKSQVEARTSTTNLPSLKYCGFCGRLMPAAYTFCPACGKTQIETETTRIEAKTTTPKKAHRPVRTITIAVALVLVLSASILTLYLFSIGLLSSPCTPSSCEYVQTREQLIMMHYNFESGTELTVVFYNAGIVQENLASAQYSLCPQNTSLCVEGTLSGSCNTGFLVVGATCQAIITVSLPSLNVGTLCTLRVVVPNQETFTYVIPYGGSA